MRLRTAVTAVCVLVAAVLPAHVAAGDCASTKLDAFHAEQRQSQFYDVCPTSLTSDFKASNATGLTLESLTSLSGFGNKPCLTALRQLAPAAPDCDVPIGNLKHLWEKQLTMCEKFYGGGIKKPELEELFKEFAGKGSSSARAVSVATSAVGVVLAAVLAAL